MDKESFINQCVEIGYCSKKTAEMYCKDKNNLTEDDFIEVFRIVERAKEVAATIDKYRKVEGVKTTKVYEHKGC
jgi:hypothetical protein